MCANLLFLLMANDAGERRATDFLPLQRKASRCFAKLFDRLARFDLGHNTHWSWPSAATGLLQRTASSSEGRLGRFVVKESMSRPSSKAGRGVLPQALPAKIASLISNYTQLRKQHEVSFCGISCFVLVR